MTDVNHLSDVSDDDLLRAAIRYEYENFPDTAKLFLPGGHAPGYFAFVLLTLNGIKLLIPLSAISSKFATDK